MAKRKLAAVAFASILLATASAPALARHPHPGKQSFNYTSDGRIIAARSTSREIGYRHKRFRAHPRHHNKVKVARESTHYNVWSISGAGARVAPDVSSKFRCLVDWLDEHKYPIEFMGGYRRHGSVRHSKHPLALAMDINQTGRNRVTHHFPPGVTKAAATCGLLHGAVWRHADTGHFEVPGRYAVLRRRHTRLAAARWM